MTNTCLGVVCCLVLAWCRWCTAERILLQGVEEEGREDGSDSLRPAIEAISRRQRDLAGRAYDTYGGLGRYHYEATKRDGAGELRPEQLEFLSVGDDGQPEDIGYGYQRGGGTIGQTAGGAGGGLRDQGGPRALERLLVEYLEGSREEEGREEEERRSAFRERGVPGRAAGDTPLTTAFRERLRTEEADEGEEEGEKRKRFLALVKRLEGEEEGEEEGGSERRRRGGRREGGEEEDDDMNKLDAYLELLEDLWDKYRSDDAGKKCGKEGSEEREARKREQGSGGGGPTYDYFNSPLGWMNGGFGRRRRAGEEERRNIYYALKSSGYGQRAQLPEEDDDLVAYRKREPEQQMASKLRRWSALEEGEAEDGAEESELAYGPRQRRFPVAKRAFKRSYGPPAKSERPTRRKKEVKTDPKVAEALSHIFSDTKKNDTKEKVDQKEEEGKKEKEGEKEGGEKEKEGGEKEVVEGGKEREEKREVKKSIDWSEYFGMDRRRKKSEERKAGGKTEEEEKLDEWLLDQYYRTLAASANAAKRKRGSGERRAPSGGMEVGEERGEEEGREEEEAEDAMDAKLRKVEDAIVEEAIKDTGAHEGAPGGRKEAEEVRGRVLSRLAAAYSLEKMRKALGEFRASLQEDEGSAGRRTDGLTEDALREGERRGSEGEERRKKKKRAEEEGEFVGPPIAEPMSEGYMGGPQGGTDPRDNDVVSGGECPALERLTTNCEGIGDLAGDYQHMFLDLCNWHEVCSICGSAASSSNQAAVSSCDITFLHEVESLCHGHDDCRQSGHRMAVALRALRGRGAKPFHHHQMKSASLCWQHPCLADYLARKRRR